MSAPYDFSPPPRRWDPTTEIHPGGPHPAAAAQMHAEAEARQAQEAAEAKHRTRNHLLLQHR